MLSARSARLIFTRALAMPMVRSSQPIGPFCRAKMSSTAECTADLRVSAWRVRAAIGRPAGFLRWIRATRPRSARQASRGGWSGNAMRGAPWCSVPRHAHPVPRPRPSRFCWKNGGPERIRTFDLCLRRAALYPAELRVPHAPHTESPPPKEALGPGRPAGRANLPGWPHHIAARTSRHVTSATPCRPLCRLRALRGRIMVSVTSRRRNRWHGSREAS